MLAPRPMLIVSWTGLFGFVGIGRWPLDAGRLIEFIAPFGRSDFPESTSTMHRLFVDLKQTGLDGC